jgi:mRNA interferase MazF
MRRHSVICERHDVVLVPFPFVDLPVTKQRPVVAVSGASFNRINGSTVFAMITTASGQKWPVDHPITDLKGAGLLHSCVVRWRLVTLPNSLILKRLGHLGSADRAACEALCKAMVV